MIRMKDAAAPGTSYVFRLAGDGKTGRTLILRFLSVDRDQDAFEAELFDPDGHRPYRMETPVWKGKLGSRATMGIVFDTAGGKDSGWDFGLIQGELPAIVCPAASKPGALFPTRGILLIPVKGP
jgi:hypothetical protein